MTPLLKGVFDRLQQGADVVKNDSSQAVLECSVRCSVVEIYLERMRDLLHDHHHTGMVVQMRPTGQFEGCASVACWNAPDTLQLIQTALAARTATSSSRSTAVIQLVIQQTRASGQQVQSRLLLLDLMGSELLQQSSSTLEATQVSISLKAMHKQVRALANSKPLIPTADLPAVTRLLSAQFTGAGTAHMTLLCTATRFRSLSSHFLKFSADCRRCTTQPISHIAYHTPDLDTTAEFQHSAERWQRWAEQLAKECQRLRDRQSWDRQLWPLVEQIANSTSASSDNTAAAAPDATVDRMRQYAQYKQALTNCAAAQAERDQLCSDVAILQAETVRCTQAHGQLVQQVEQLQRENRVLQVRKRQAEETLRVAQFREAEATVFLRQLRKFYVRLVQTAVRSGGGGTECEGIALQQQLVDMDQFMLQSGLLDDSEVGATENVATDPRPTRAALERSIAQTEKEAMKTAEEAGAEPAEEEQQTNDAPEGTVVPLDPERPPPVSVVEKEESPATIEARQKLFQTPSGRYLAMRDKILETELSQALEVNAQLKAQLDEEKTNVHVLRSHQAGTAGPLDDKMRIAQEIRALKDQLTRKNNDLKAVIWKMNELHMVGKNLSRTLEGRGQRLASTEKSLAELQHRHVMGTEKNAANEQNTSAMIHQLQDQIKELVVPIWQLSQESTALPLSGRLIIPLPNGCDVSPTSEASVGEPGEWADIDYYPPSQNLVDNATQTNPRPKEDCATQTSESVRVVDQKDTQSVSIQTDDVHINDAGTGITEDNIFNFMFMDSPNNGAKECVPWEATTPAQNRSQSTVGNANQQGDVAPSPLVATTPLQAPPVGEGSILDSFLYDEPSTHSHAEKTSAVISEYMTGISLGMGDDLDHDDLILESGDKDEFQSPYYEMNSAALKEEGAGTADSLKHESYDPSSYFDGIEGMIAVSTPASYVIPSGTLPSQQFQSTHGACLSPPEAKSIDGPRPLSILDRERGSPKRSPPKYRTDSQDSPVSLQKGAVSSETTREALPHQRNKTPDKPKSAFLLRLQNQAKKKILDADEKSETPEFLRLFQTIGAANQNEAVVETAGAAPTRVAQRTSFETLKLRRNDTSTVESGSAPATTWKPKKKKTADDSDASSSDDSFAKSFMKGAQMADSKGDDGSSSSSDDSFAKSFMKGAQVSTPKQIPEADEENDDSEGPHAQESKTSSPASVDDADLEPAPTAAATSQMHSPAKTLIKSDSDSSSSDPTSRQKVATPSTAVPSKPSERKTSYLDSSNSSDSDDSSTARRKQSIVSNKQAPASGQGTKADAKKKSYLDSSSSSDSDDSSKKNLKRPITSNKPALVPDKPNPVDSESSDSDDKPSTKISATPSAAATKPKQQSLDSDSSDDSSEAKPASRPPPAKPASTSKGSSDSDSDSSNEASRKPSLQPQQAQSKKPVNDSDSEDSSSSGSTRAAAKPVVRKTKDSSSSDGDSDDSSDKGSRRIPPSQAQKPSSDSDSDSSSDESAEKPTKPSATHSKSTSKSSDSSESSSSEDDSSDTAPTRSRQSAAPKKASTPSSSDGTSSSDSSSNKRSKAKSQVTPKTNMSNKKIGGSSSDMSKFVIKEGKLVRRDGKADASQSTKSPKAAPGKRSKAAKGRTGKSSKSDQKRKGKPTGQKAAFKIVNGKLVKNEDV